MTAKTAQQERTLGLGGAVTLNLLDMIGVGPFITLPLLVGAMGGPQAMLGWVLGALLAVCDGMVWAELGAAMPEAGGTYAYLRGIFPGRLGRWLSFLFVFQLCFSAPLSVASGCIGLAQYAGGIWPRLGVPMAVHAVRLGPYRFGFGVGMADGGGAGGCTAGGKPALPATRAGGAVGAGAVAGGVGGDRMDGGNGAVAWAVGPCGGVFSGSVCAHPQFLGGVRVSDARRDL